MGFPLGTPLVHTTKGALTPLEFPVCKNAIMEQEDDVAPLCLIL